MSNLWLALGLLLLLVGPATPPSGLNFGRRQPAKLTPSGGRGIGPGGTHQKLPEGVACTDNDGVWPSIPMKPCTNVQQRLALGSMVEDEH